MRFAAVGLFLATFAVATWAIRIAEPTDPPGQVGEPASQIASPAGHAPQPVAPVAEGGTRAEPRFKIPDGCKAMSVRADVSDELAGKLTLGTKVDVLLLPRDQRHAGPPELVVAGVFVIVHSMNNTVDEKTGAASPQVEPVCLAVTEQQAGVLIRTEERGRFRIVPAD